MTAGKTEERRDVEDADQTVLFAGELDDPWVGLIVTSIRKVVSVRTVDLKGPLPARLSGDLESLRAVIIHRCRLSQADVCRIEGYHQENRSHARPEIIVCYSPYVRYAELERCSLAVDLLLPEASALDILPSHLSRDIGIPAAISDDAQRGSIKVEVISTDHALRATLEEICLAAGFESQESSDAAFASHSVRSSRTPSGSSLTAKVKPQPVVTVWDVPVLETGWAELLEHRSRLGPVIALLGFADRATVGLARASGAAACLDLPFDVLDLIEVLDRVTRPMLAEREPRGPGRLESPEAAAPPQVSRAGKAGEGRLGIAVHPPSLKTPGPNKTRRPADLEAGSRSGAVARRRNDV